MQRSLDDSCEKAVVRQRTGSFWTSAGPKEKKVGRRHLIITRGGRHAKTFEVRGWRGGTPPTENGWRKVGSEKGKSLGCSQKLLYQGRGGVVGYEGMEHASTGLKKVGGGGSLTGGRLGKKET